MHCPDCILLLLGLEVLDSLPHFIIYSNGAAVWAVQPVGLEADLHPLRLSFMDVEDISACIGIVFIIWSFIDTQGALRPDCDVHLHRDLQVLLFLHWGYSFVLIN